MNITIPAKIDGDEVLETLSRKMFEGATLELRIDIEINEATITVISIEDAIAILNGMIANRRKWKAEQAAKAQPT